MRVLVLGAGPIEIGQAAEFDYAGTQACTALREAGVEVILLNSNPATIMTDPEVAEKVYIEPLSWEVVEKIVEQEKPDAILATMGGQTALNLALELESLGLLSRWGIPLLGTDIDSIKLAEDREAFRDLLTKLGEPSPTSMIVTDIAEALDFTRRVGYPVVVRPAYTLGGAGGGFSSNEAELRKYVASGLRQSPIKQVLLEQSIAGLVEVEYEMLRDAVGYSLVVCDLENVDPVGIHTGDSIVVAPAQTLSARQQNMLQTAALKVVEALKVVGSCNVQFALEPRTNQYYFIEVNPRVSRSSALASKATGFPIAQVAAKLALGGSLKDYEVPTLPYVVVKIPRWPFDKFPTANRKLGTQMKSTGEIMALGCSFAEAFQKGLRSLELEWKSLFAYPFVCLSDEDLFGRLSNPDDERVFLLAEFFRRGYTVNNLAKLTKISKPFLLIIQELVHFYTSLSSQALTPSLLKEAKRSGFSDSDLAAATGLSVSEVRATRRNINLKPYFYQVPTQGGHFYFSSYGQVLCALATPSEQSRSAVVVLGSGPIRIGQGIEFDYATVHAALTIRSQGYESVVINNNPETVSTDATIAQRLYFEPLTAEDVLAVIEHEQPAGVMVQFGGQTAINLVEPLHAARIRIFGTTAPWIARMEDRQKFDAALEHLGLLRPQGLTAHSKEAAKSLALQLDYPVMVRPSYVLGGRGMEVLASSEELENYLAEISDYHGYPLLFDHYLPGIELEVDAIADGHDVFVAGIMEHLERAGVHSGDSIAVCPAQSLSDDTTRQVYEYTKNLALHFKARGLLNIQYVFADGELYVLEVNPRSSRTVPFLSKTTGIPLARMATQVSLGCTLADLGYVGFWQAGDGTVAVKMPVFSFAKLEGMEVTLGPEMKSTGEVMGRDFTLNKALRKAFVASKVALPSRGKALITVADKDKKEMIPLARRLQRLGIQITATLGTAQLFKEQGIACHLVPKLHQSSDILDLLQSDSLDFVVNTFTKGKKPQRDGFKIRSQASLQGVLCFTSLDTLASYLQVVEDQTLWIQPLKGRDNNGNIAKQTAY